MKFIQIASALFAFSPVLAFAGYAEMTPHDIEDSIKIPEDLLNIDLLENELNSENGEKTDPKVPSK